MRETKFRIWDEVGQKYFTENIFIDSSGQLWIWDKSKKTTGPYGFIKFKTSAPVIEFFTGLKDKNGKEIYEGDIIEYDDYSRGACIGFSQHRTTGVIKIEGNLFGHIKLVGNGFSEPKNPIVIGNIHNNPDLS